MSKIRSIPNVAGILAVVALLGAVMGLSVQIRPAFAAPVAGPLPQGEPVSADVVPSEARIRPEELVKALKSASGEKPLVLYVGFRVLYGQAHIPGAENIGPGAQPEGLANLRKRTETLSRKKLIVIYCGCCPWEHCPNLGPAYETLHKMGFTRVKALYIANNLGTDWVAKGYPIEKGL